MSVFKKAIMRIDSAVKSGHFIGAGTIAKKHIETEHHFEGDLAKLQRRLAAFSEHLSWVANLSELSTTAEKNFDKKVAQNLVDTLKLDMVAIEILITHIKEDLEE
ncbi:MAG: hypothetical protein WC595_04985 [Candidatus Nanoarchaeia archaeon]